MSQKDISICANALGKLLGSISQPEASSGSATEVSYQEVSEKVAEIVDCLKRIELYFIGIREGIPVETKYKLEMEIYHLKDKLGKHDELLASTSDKIEGWGHKLEELKNEYVKCENSSTVGDS